VIDGNLHDDARRDRPADLAEPLREIYLVSPRLPASVVPFALVSRAVGSFCSRDALKVSPPGAGADFGIAVPLNATKDLQIEALVAPGTLSFRELLASLSRDELKVACRSHDVDDTGRARTALAARLLQSRGTRETIPPKPILTAHEIPRCAPRPGDIVPVLSHT